MQRLPLTFTAGNRSTAYKGKGAHRIMLWNIISFVLNSAPLLIGLTLVGLLLAVIGIVPLFTSLLSGAAVLVLLLAHNVNATISVIAAVLVWFILWRIGACVRNRRRKGNATPHGKLSTEDPAVRVVLNDMQETINMMLAAGKGASMVSSGKYEGSIAIMPVSRNKDNVYQIAMMMLETPNLLDAVSEFIRCNPKAFVADPSRFAPLVVFAETYQSFYIPEDHRYLIITSEKLTLPRRATKDDLLNLCMDEIIRRNDLAIRFSNCIIHTRNVAR